MKKTSILAVILFSFGAFSGNPLEIGQNSTSDAIRNGNLEMLNALLDQGADPNLGGSYSTLLYQAVSRIYTSNDLRIAMVKALLEHGANPDLGEPLRVAAGRGDLEIAQMLLSRGANVNTAKNYDKFTPLHDAYYSQRKTPVKHNQKMVDFLIANGADENAKDRDGCTPQQREGGFTEILFGRC